MLLAKMKTEFPEPVRERIADENDRASDILEKDLELTLKDRDRVRLKMLEDARSRLERGSYRICEECDRPIPVKRLVLNPVALLCTECQDRAERKAGRKRASNMIH